MHVSRQAEPASGLAGPPAEDLLLAGEQAAAIRAAYLAREGGYRRLAARFGRTKREVAECIRQVGIKPEAANMVAEDIPGVEQHARDRLLERLGMSPTKAEWKAAYLLVREGKALLVRRQQHGKRISEVRAVRLAGREVFVAYNPHSQRIITVLPNGLASLSGR